MNKDDPNGNEKDVERIYGLAAAVKNGCYCCIGNCSHTRLCIKAKKTRLNTPKKPYYVILHMIDD